MSCIFNRARITSTIVSALSLSLSPPPLPRYRKYTIRSQDDVRTTVGHPYNGNHAGSARSQRYYGAGKISINLFSDAVRASTLLPILKNRGNISCAGNCRR